MSTTQTVEEFYNSASALQVPTGEPHTRFTHPKLLVTELSMYSLLGEVFIDAIDGLNTIEIEVHNLSPFMVGSDHLQNLRVGVNKPGSRVFVTNVLPYTKPPARSNAQASVAGIEMPGASLGLGGRITVAGVPHTELDLTRALRVYIRVPADIASIVVRSTHGPIALRGEFSDSTRIDIVPTEGRVEHLR